MGKYQNEAKQLVDLVGGTENITTVTHCATRLRFVLADDAKADIKGIEKLETVKGTFTNAGQFQVIIGNDVADFYRDFIVVSGVKEATKEDVKKAAQKNQPFLQRMVAHLAEIFVPLIPALVAGGLLLGFRNVLENPMSGQTLAYKDQYDWAMTLFNFTGWISLSVFAFLPALVAWSTVKKFGGTVVLGIVLGLMLVSPSMMNAYEFGGYRSKGIDVKEMIHVGAETYSKDTYKDLVKDYPEMKKIAKTPADLVTAVTKKGGANPAGALAEKAGYSEKKNADDYKELRAGIIEVNAAATSTVTAGQYEWNLFGYNVSLIGYQAQVLPALFAGITLVYIERFMNKITPEVLKLVVVPFVALVATGLLTILFIGPVARGLGDALTGFFTFMFTTPGLKYIGAILFGGLYAPLVITGLHHTFIAVDLQLAADGGTFIWPMIAISNISQAGAALATFFIYKSEKQKAVSSSATVSAWFGITEPAMFGANLKYMYPMIAAIIGSILGALICTAFGVKAVSIGVGGLALAWMSIYSQYMIPFLVASAVATIVPIILTFVFSKTKLNKGSLSDEEPGA